MFSSRSAPVPPPTSLTHSTQTPTELLAPAPTVHWGAQTLSDRGVIQPFHLRGSVPAPYNAIGTHRGTGWSGSAINHAIKVIQSERASLGCRSSIHASRPASDTPRSIYDHLTSELTGLVAPHPGWFGPNAPVSLDPFGALAYGEGIHPTISIRRTALRWLELDSALEHGWLEADGSILQANGQLQVTRIQIAPVWYLPGVAQRLQVDEAALRQALYESTDGLFPELLTRTDLSVFLPPLAATIVDILGPVESLRDEHTAVSLHIDSIDSRQESATDHPVAYTGWVQALETCIETAQSGGVGVMISLSPYLRTASYSISIPEPYTPSPSLTWELQLMPDVLQWLGICRVDQLLAMSYDCSDHIARAGIEVVQQVRWPNSHNVESGLSIEAKALELVTQPNHLSAQWSLALVTQL